MLFGSFFKKPSPAPLEQEKSEEFSQNERHVLIVMALHCWKNNTRGELTLSAISAELRLRGWQTENLLGELETLIKKGCVDSFIKRETPASKEERFYALSERGMTHLGVSVQK